MFPMSEHAGTKNVQSSRDTRQNAGLLRSRIHGSTASENCLSVLKRRTHHTKLCFIWPQVSLLFEKSVLFRDMFLISGSFACASAIYFKNWRLTHVYAQYSPQNGKTLFGLRAICGVCCFMIKKSGMDFFHPD